MMWLNEMEKHKGTCFSGPVQYLQSRTMTQVLAEHLEESDSRPALAGGVTMKVPWKPLHISRTATHRLTDTRTRTRTRRHTGAHTQAHTHLLTCLVVSSQHVPTLIYTQLRQQKCKLPVRANVLQGLGIAGLDWFLQFAKDDRLKLPEDAVESLVQGHKAGLRSLSECLLLGGLGLQLHSPFVSLASACKPEFTNFVGRVAASHGPGFLVGWCKTV